MRRCFRIQKLRQFAKRIMREPVEVHIPKVAEIPIPPPAIETPLPKAYTKPEKEVSFKRKNW